MSRFDELIAEFCPDGVEYRRLGDVANIKRGTRVVKKNLSASEGYPVFQNSLAPLGYHTDFNEPAGTPFIICAGAAGEIGYSESEYWAADDCYSIECSEALDSKYALHSLLHSQGTLKAQVRKASIPRLSKDVVTRLEIPVPAIKVQHEIARILDAFAELTTELTTELTCRKQQYAYYRDRLLSRESLEAMDDKPVEMKRLDEISISIKAGGDVPDDTVKGQTEPTDTHPYPVFSNGSNDKALYGYCSKYSIEKESVTISARGSIGFHSVRKPYFTPVVRLITVTPDVETITSAYLDLALTQTSINGDKGGIPQLTIPKVKGIEIPVPSLETQRKVVDILDRFDALTTSLTDGIPAEIEARKAQNAYYRDRLLDFPRKSGDAS